MLKYILYEFLNFLDNVLDAHKHMHADLHSKKHDFHYIPKQTNQIFLHNLKIFMPVNAIFCIVFDAASTIL